MALSEQYTTDRLDRLAGDVRDEAASRREDTSELRSELREEIRMLRTETGKEVDGLWRLLLVAAVALVITLCIAVDDADAAPLMSSPSTHHLAPASAALRGIRTDQRFDDLNRKIDDGSDRAAEDLLQLRRHMKSGLEGVEDKTRRREAILYALTIGIVFFFFFLTSVIEPSFP